MFWTVVVVVAFTLFVAAINTLESAIKESKHQRDDDD